MCSRRRRDSCRLVVAALLVASGCNELLGLDPTVTDTDGDGIVDPDDNCPFDYNPPQLDRDNDGRGDPCSPCVGTGVDLDDDGLDDACDGCVGPGTIGVDVDADGIDDGCDPCTVGDGSDGDADGIEDGCDTCLGGRAHDEDADDHHDACDNCPANANPGQENNDLDAADALGDACDPAPTRESVALFDPFDVPDPARWPNSMPGFMQGDDEIVVDPTLMAERVSTAIAPHPVAVETRLGRLAAGRAGPILRGIGGSQTFACIVGADGVLTLTVELGVPVTTEMASGVDVSGPVVVTLVTKPGSDGFDLSCEAIGANQQRIATPSIRDQPPFTFLIGQRVDAADATFQYIWSVFTP